MWIRIKNDVIRLDETMVFSFNDSEGSVIIYSKAGLSVIFSQEYKQGVVPRSRVISKAEYAAIKAWIIDKQKPEVVV